MTAEEMYESWINGNRTTVVRELLLCKNKDVQLEFIHLLSFFLPDEIDRLIVLLVSTPAPNDSGDGCGNL